MPSTGRPKTTHTTYRFRCYYILLNHLPYFPLLIIFLLQGKSWVDIGCGNGAFTAQIIEKCAPCKVEGIDPSDAQVEGAKKCSWKVPVNFQTGDAMALPYDSDSFDIGK